MPAAYVSSVSSRLPFITKKSPVLTMISPLNSRLNGPIDPMGVSVYLNSSEYKRLFYVGMCCCYGVGEYFSCVAGEGESVLVGHKNNKSSFS